MQAMCETANIRADWAEAISQDVSPREGKKGISLRSRIQFPNEKKKRDDSSIFYMPELGEELFKLDVVQGGTRWRGVL